MKRLLGLWHLIKEEWFGVYFYGGFIYMLLTVSICLLVGVREVMLNLAIIWGAGASGILIYIMIYEWIKDVKARKAGDFFD